MTLFIFLQPHRLSDYQENLGLGGSTFKGEKIKVKKLKGALSNPIPLVKRSSEQFLFLRLHVWKALPSIFSTSMGISMGKWPKSIKWPKSLFEVRCGFLRCIIGGFWGLVRRGLFSGIFWFGHPKCHFWYPQNGSFCWGGPSRHAISKTKTVLSSSGPKEWD